MKRRKIKKRKLPKKEFIIKEIKEYAVAIIFAYIVFIIIRQFVQLGFISGDSMLETYHDHQPVIIYKRDDNHEVGEVLTFEYTQDLEENASEISGASSSAVVGNQHVKRVVAVAGDHVVIKEDNLYVNDILVSESSNTLVEQDYIVEENEVFVAGDNIDESYDSRYHGTIKIENITGVVITGDDNQAYNN